MELPPVVLAALHATSELYNERVEDILSDKRHTSVVKARHALVYALSKTGRFTHAEIANYLNRDVSTVSVSAEKIRLLLARKSKDASEATETTTKIIEAAKRAYVEPDRPMALHSSGYATTAYVPRFVLDLEPAERDWLQLIITKGIYVQKVFGGWLLSLTALVELWLIKPEQKPVHLKRLAKLIDDYSRNYQYLWIFAKESKHVAKG